MEIHSKLPTGPPQTWMPIGTELVGTCLTLAVFPEPAVRSSSPFLRAKNWALSEVAHWVLAGRRAWL